jgi:hypothetical protein
MGTLNEGQYTFLIISRLFLPGNKKISYKCCRVKQNKNFMLNNYHISENRAVYDIVVMWKNIVDPDRLQVTIWCKSYTCWISKATDTHTEYAILITFPLHQWLMQPCLNVTFHIHCLPYYCEIFLFPCTAFRVEDYPLLTTICWLLSIAVYFQLPLVAPTV